jgi:FkbM family methyltransferase
MGTKQTFICFSKLPFPMLKYKQIRSALFSYFLIWRELTAERFLYTIKNPFVILRKAGVIKLTDGNEFPFSQKNKRIIFSTVYFLLNQGIRLGNQKYSWNFDINNLILTTHQGIHFHAENVNLLDETFLYQIHYSGFDLQGKTVITAGAFIGDTPLYYSYYGARVVALEPDPNSFKMAKKNISLNPELGGRITLLNYALGFDDMIEFPVREDSGGSSKYDKDGAHVKIRSVSISTLLKELDIKTTYLLDIDIKGAEFELIEDPVISKFEKIRIEYSTFYLNDAKKSLEYLIQRLNQYGFKKIRVWKHNSLRFDLLYHGTIDAEK